MPLKGRVTFAGQDMARLEIEDRVAAGLSLVPEHRELFATMTVEDNSAARRVPDREGGCRKIIRAGLCAVSRLKERRRQLAGTLSGGEQQMLAMGAP